MGVFGKLRVEVGLGCLVHIGAHRSYAWPESGEEEADRMRKMARSRRGGRVRKNQLARLDPRAGCVDWRRPGSDDVLRRQSLVEKIPSVAGL